MSKRSTRRIVVDHKIYTYVVGKDFAVIRDDTGFARIVSLSDLVGLYPDTITRGKHKGTSDGMIRPKHIAEYIKRSVS